MTNSTFVKRIPYYTFSIFLFMSPMLLSGQCAPDTEDPEAKCKNLTLGWEVFTTGNSIMISANDVNNGSTDNCSIASMTLDKSTFNCESLGDNTVILTVTDAAGNTDNCSSTVTIRDATAPEISCVDPAPVYTNSTDAFVTVPTPAIGDNCSLAPEEMPPGGIPMPLTNDYTNTPDASNLFPVGVTTVTWTVFDEAGNSTDCQVYVRVIAGQDPNITLSSQAEVNDFVANYYGSTITGSLIISGADITDLSGLGILSSIGGDLRIEANTLLTNIDGLQNITSIGGGLFFLNNPALTEIDGLRNITSIGGLIFLNNPLLTNIDGLQNLSSPVSINIFNNDALTNIDGLHNIQEISYLDIRFNAALTNIDGLQNATGNIYFRIQFNDVLGEFCGVLGIVSAGSNGDLFGNAENPLLEDIANGEACSRILLPSEEPAEGLPLLPLPYLMLLGLTLLGVASMGVRRLV